jgi:hypothetical protein
MVRTSLSPILRGAGAAVVLVAVVACGGTPDGAAGGGAAAEPADEGPPPPSGTAPVDAGSRSSGTGAAAFTQVGTSYAEWLRTGPGACDGGRCTLSYEFVESSEHESGCAVDDFRYDPPARPEGADRAGQVIQRGTAVTVVVVCAPGASPTEARSGHPASAEARSSRSPVA